MGETHRHHKTNSLRQSSSREKCGSDSLTALEAEHRILHRPLRSIHTSWHHQYKTTIHSFQHEGLLQESQDSYIILPKLPYFSWYVLKKTIPKSFHLSNRPTTAGCPAPPVALQSFLGRLSPLHEAPAGPTIQGCDSLAKMLCDNRQK